MDETLIVCRSPTGLTPVRSVNAQKDIYEKVQMLRYTVDP